MINLCFVVNNLSNSSFKYNLLKYTADSSSNDLSLSIFYQYPSQEIIQPCCFVSNISGLSEFDGTVVAISLDCAAIVAASTTKLDKWVYFENLDWLYSVINYQYCNDMLKEFTIVAKSESHAQNISNFTGRKDILTAKNFKELEGLIRAKRS